MNINEKYKDLYKGSVTNSLTIKGFNRLIELIENKEHELLSDYISSKTKVLIDYKCGHNPHWITPSNYKNGNGCPKCNGVCREQAKEELISVIDKKGHELLSEYVNNLTKVLIDFKCEHEPHWISPSNYKRGQGCPKCIGHCPDQAKEDFIKLLDNNGHKLLSEYINNSTKVLVNFQCGHNPHWITPNQYKQGHGCSKCGGNCREQAKKELISMIDKKGHELLSEYVTAKTNVLIDFKCGHNPHWITPGSYKQGNGCPKCSGQCPEQAKEDLIKLIESNGHILLSEYINTETKVLIDFNCGHDSHWISPSNYKRGHSCPKCNTSKGEKVIYDYLIENNYKVEAQYMIDKHRYKYDLYLEQFNLLVEIHGIQHYEYQEHFHITYDGFEKEKQNDQYKLELALSEGYNYMIVDYREHDPQLTLERFIGQLHEFL